MQGQSSVTEAREQLYNSQKLSFSLHVVLTLGKRSYCALFDVMGALEVGSDLYNVGYTERHHGVVNVQLRCALCSKDLLCKSNTVNLTCSTQDSVW